MATTAELYESLSNGDATGQSRSPAGDPWTNAALEQRIKAHDIDPGISSPEWSNVKLPSYPGIQGNIMNPAMRQEYGTPENYQRQSDEFLKSRIGQPPIEKPFLYEKDKDKKSLLDQLYPQMKA